MASESKIPGMKQLKVDNWATFFLQRLQLLFAKGDSCDITLKFFTGQELKVHSLVLRTCTSHFDTLPKDDDVISLPEVLSYSAVFPIINFMYSGKLEFKPELQSKLLAIAKILNITILLKLLLAQRDGPSGSSGKGRSLTSNPDGSKLSPQQLLLQQASPPSLGLFAGKKLPFWRKRSIPILNKFGERKTVEEEPGPTRFNWPENESTDWILISSPSFCPLSYETEPIVKAPIKVEAEQSSPPPQRRIIESRLLTTHDSDDDDDDRFRTNYSSDEEPQAPPPPPPPPPPTTPAPAVLKPCLKSPSTENPSPLPTKRVRFSLGPEGKENSGNSNQNSNLNSNLNTSLNSNLNTSLNSNLNVSLNSNLNASLNSNLNASLNSNLNSNMNSNINSNLNSNLHSNLNSNLNSHFNSNSMQNSASNHAKIIAEVLKKYPDLVKNKNIKLKISSPKPKVENGVSNEEKASYVVLRPTLRAGTTGSVSSPSKNEPCTGPWFCDHCPEIKFEQYQDFRKHLQEAHGEKLDARICEYCGYKASKRNLHLYHLFTKHNVPPPKNINFPKCNECTYVALSESLLAKHMNNHLQGKEFVIKEPPKEFQCDICKVNMKNQASLYVHKVTCSKQANGPRNIICDLCKTAFRTNINLNAHLKECQGKPEPMFSDNGDHPVEMIEVPIIEAVNMEKGDHALVQLPPGIILADNQNMALLPASSASDGLNSVTSGLATSIALAIPQDQGQAVILLHGNGPEYIVPEFLDGSFATGNIAYTTGENQVIYLGSTGNGNQQEVIHLEEIKINQTSPSTSAIQDKHMPSKEVVQSTLTVPIVQASTASGKAQIGQNVIINVQGDLAQSANAQLEQSGLILINTNKQIERNLQPNSVEVTENSVDKNNSKIIIEIPDDNDENVSGVNQESVPIKTIEAAQAKGNIKEKKGNETPVCGTQLEETKLLEDKDSSGSAAELQENEPLQQKEAVEESESGNLVLPSQQNKDLLENNNTIRKAPEDNSIKSPTETTREQEMPLDNSKSREVITVRKEPTIVLDSNAHADITVETIEDSRNEKSVEVDVQENAEAEQMQVDEGREDMIIDENKEDEQMDVEENAEKESKDAMDVEETDKTGDERVDSLVKDWGFDDDDTEEVIDDPDCKPLRPDIEIPL